MDSENLYWEYIDPWKPPWNMHSAPCYYCDGGIVPDRCRWCYHRNLVFASACSQCMQKDKCKQVSYRKGRACDSFVYLIDDYDEIEESVIHPLKNVWGTLKISEEKHDIEMNRFTKMDARQCTIHSEYNEYFGSNYGFHIGACIHKLHPWKAMYDRKCAEIIATRKKERDDNYARMKRESPRWVDLPIEKVKRRKTKMNISVHRWLVVDL